MKGLKNNTLVILLPVCGVALCSLSAESLVHDKTITMTALSFKHHVVDNRLGQRPGQMADVGRLGLADIDNDGDLDFAMGVRHMQAYWYEFQEGNIWVKHVLGPWGEQKLGGTPHDVDGDGHVDFVTGGSWYRNPGNPKSAPFTEYVFDPAGDHSMHDVVIADMNRDGKKDVVLQGDVGPEMLQAAPSLPEYKISYLPLKSNQ